MTSPAATFDSPGTFLSHLNAEVFDPAKVNEIKTAVIRAIGTLDDVFLIPEIELSAKQIEVLGFGSSGFN